MPDKRTNGTCDSTSRWHKWSKWVLFSVFLPADAIWNEERKIQCNIRYRNDFFNRSNSRMTDEISFRRQIVSMSTTIGMHFLFGNWETVTFDICYSCAPNRKSTTLYWRYSLELERTESIYSAPVSQRKRYNTYTRFTSNIFIDFNCVHLVSTRHSVAYADDSFITLYNQRKKCNTLSHTDEDGDWRAKRKIKRKWKTIIISRTHLEVK